MKRLFFLLFGVLTALMSYAQDDSDRPKLTVTIPQDTVYQGDTLHVVYTIDVKYNLDFKGFSHSSEDARMEGAEQRDFKSQSVDLSKTLSRKTFTATFLVKGCGNLALLPFKVMLNEAPVYSDTIHINVLPDPIYGLEWTIADSFLRGKGVETRNLEYKYGTETFKAFSDNAAPAFVIVASSPYDQYLKDPILAYGTGNAMWNGIDKQKDNSIYYIMSRYDYQLKELRRLGLVYNGLELKGYKPDSIGVQPLLGDIHFDQADPYNHYCPAETVGGREVKCLTGCGPVALAQVLSYHHSPIAPQGVAPFSTMAGKEYKINVTDYLFSWGGTNDDKARLLMNCVASVESKLSPGGSSSSLSNFKSALVGIWRYNPRCTRTYKGDYVAMLRSLYSEIDASRPVIVADENHIYVCDGYHGDFLHFNLGWKGYCNGYYRTIVLPSLLEWQLPFSEILTGIRPADEPLEVAVRVDVPGNLQQSLAGYDIMGITSLKISGTIDGDDINLIRSMAGASAQSIMDGACGSLMHIDLSDATIKGGKTYATMPGDNITIQRTRRGSKEFVEYRLDNVTDDDWAEMRRNGNDKMNGMNMERTPDGKIYVSYYTPDDNVIGQHMFDGCENIVTLNLPRKTKRVDDYAFKDCRSMKKVGYLPKNPTSSLMWVNSRFLNL